MTPTIFGVDLFSALFVTVIYGAGFFAAIDVVTGYVTQRVLTRNKPGRVLAVVLWPVALTLLAAIVAMKKVNTHCIQPFRKDWRRMLNAK